MSPEVGLPSQFSEDGAAEPVVIGGMVLDINATPSSPAKPKTTTPGKVSYELGGVARNLAECMLKLGARPFMISAVGIDMAGNLLLEHWKSAGLFTEGIQRHQDIETAVVCNIFDRGGELAAAVASVEAIEKFLTPKWIKRFESIISSAPLLLVDANLSLPALEASCEAAVKCSTPIWFEPVSVTKSARVASVVKYVNFVSPNEDELIAMANTLSGADIYSPIRTSGVNINLSAESLFQTLKPAVLVLLEKGIKVVILTVGSCGVFLCSKSNHCSEKLDLKDGKLASLSWKLYKNVNASCPPGRFFSAKSASNSNAMAWHFPALSASVVRLTGAGDCLVGGAAASLCTGLDVMQSVAVGVAAAKAAVEAESNVPAEYCLSKIASDARTVYLSARMVFCQSML